MLDFRSSQCHIFKALIAEQLSGLMRLRLFDECKLDVDWCGSYSGFGAD